MKTTLKTQNNYLIFNKTLLGCLAGLFCFGAQAQFYLGKFGPYVPTEGNFSAEIQVLDFTPQVRSLTARLQTNIDANAQWFEGYAEQTQAGQKLPYHANFGISEAEYQILLAGEDNKVLESAGKTQLVILFRNNQQTIQVTGLPGEPPFDGFLYEPVSDSILSSYGTITKSSAAEGVLGSLNPLSWQGRLWKHNQASESRQIEVVYVLGELKDGSKNIIVHQITGLVDNQPIDYHYVLVWEK